MLAFIVIYNKIQKKYVMEKMQIYAEKIPVTIICILFTLYLFNVYSMVLLMDWTKRVRKGNGFECQRACIV